MEKNKITSLDLHSLEQEYIKILWEIQNTKKLIIDLLKFQVTIENEDDTDNFIWNIKKSIKSLDKQVTESDLSKELTEKNNYLKKITQELENRRKELFDNFDATLIPLDKLSVIKSFLSNYQKPKYKENIKQQIKITQQFSMDTPLRDLTFCFSVRTLNGLVDMKTLWEMIKLYQEEWKLWFLKRRNFWKKSRKEIETFLEENGFIK